MTNWLLSSLNFSFALVTSLFSDFFSKLFLITLSEYLEIPVYSARIYVPMDSDLCFVSILIWHLFLAYFLFNFVALIIMSAQELLLMSLSLISQFNSRIICITLLGSFSEMSHKHFKFVIKVIIFPHHRLHLG